MLNAQEASGNVVMGPGDYFCAQVVRDKKFMRWEDSCNLLAWSMGKVYGIMGFYLGLSGCLPLCRKETE